MDGEELYDSLDELDTLSGATLKDVVQPKPFIQNYDIANIVPLYGRETLKEHLKPVKKSMRKSKSKIPIPQFTTNSKKKFGKAVTEIKMTSVSNVKRCSSVKDIVDFKEQKTYTTMFYTRIGHPNGRSKKKSMINDTARAVRGDYSNRTDESSISTNTHYSDAQSSISDSASFYFKLIEENKFEPKKVSNISSITDIDMSSSQSSSTTMNKPRKLKKSVTLTVPTLGGLGPDIASNQPMLNRLRKKNTYGQKVSIHNRIKIMERKVLKDLKKELEMSNCLDRSTVDLLK